MDTFLIFSILISACIVAVYLRALMIASSVYYLERAAARALMYFDLDAQEIHAHLYGEYTSWLATHELTEHMVSYRIWLEIVIEDGRLVP